MPRTITNTISSAASIDTRELNLITNADASLGTTGWTPSSGAMVIARLVGSGPLSPTINTSFTLTATTAAAYAAVTADVGPAMRSRKLKVEWQQLAPVSGDWTLEVWDGGTKLALTTDSATITAIPAANGKFTAYFDTAAATTALSIRFVRSASGGSKTLTVTAVTCGPGIQPQGAVVGPPTAFTFPVPTNLGTGSATNSANGYRVGSVLSVKLRCLKDGSGGSGGSAVTFSMPTGLTIDTTALPSNNLLGNGGFAGATFGPRVNVKSDSSTTFTLEKNATATNFLGSDFTASGELNLELNIPIAEWAGSGTMNLAENSVEYASNSSTSTTAGNTSSFVYGPSGSVIQEITATLTRQVRLQTPIQVGDKLSIEVSSDRVKWKETPCFINGLNIEAARFDGTNNIGVAVELASVLTDARDCNVVFGRYSTGTTTSWAGTAAFFWRVRKVSGGQAVGFGLATATQSGLVAGSQIPGSITNDDASTGNIGQLMESVRLRSAATAMTSSTDATLLATAITLTGGHWDIYGFAAVTGGATTLSLWRADISTGSTQPGSPPTNPYSATDSRDGFSTGSSPGSNLANGDVIQSFPIATVKVASGNTQTFNVIIRATFSGGAATCSGYGRLSAKRVR